MNTVSVVIPAFNSAKYIGEAIQSVLEQTHLPFEVLVIDDGSTDETPEVVQKYPVQYFRQENAGPSAARNTGITNAKGEFVAFLDSDDLWLTQKLAVQLEAFRRHPDAGFSFSTVWNLYRGSNPKVDTEPYWPSQLEAWLTARRNNESEEVYGSVYELLLHKNCIATSSIIVRRDLIERVGLFDVNLRGCEDYDYWIRMARLAPAVFINKPTSRYRIVDEGLSGQWDARSDRFYTTAIRVLEAHMAAFPSVMVRRALGASIADYAYHCLVEGRYSEAIRLSRRALSTCPTLKGVKVILESSFPRVFNFISHFAHWARTVQR